MTPAEIQKREMIRALLAADGQDPMALLSQLPQAKAEDSPNAAWDASKRGDGHGQSFVDVGGEYYPVGPYIGPEGPLAQPYSDMLAANPGYTDAGGRMRAGMFDGTWPPAANKRPAANPRPRMDKPAPPATGPRVRNEMKPSVMTPQGFGAYKEGALGAQRSFAPGPGTKVAQNETANDETPTMEELAEMAASVGFDPNTLIGLDLNATEAKNLGLTIRMMQAESALRPREQLGTKMRERALEWLPGETLENMAYGSGFLGTDPQYQQYRNARDSFANAALRADTGATINESELPEIIRESMPLPGDTQETIDQKRRIREGRIRALIAGTGEASAMLPQPGQPIISPQNMSDEEFLKSLGIE